jgi:hypothetical protein
MPFKTPGSKPAQLLKLASWWTILLWIAIAGSQLFWVLRDLVESQSVPGFAWRKLVLFAALASFGVTYSFLVLRRARYSGVVGSALLSLFCVWAFSQPAVQIISHWDSIDLSRTGFVTRLTLAKWMSFCCLTPIWFFFCIHLRHGRVSGDPETVSTH